MGEGEKGMNILGEESKGGKAHTKMRKEGLIFR